MVLITDYPQVTKSETLLTLKHEILETYIELAEQMQQCNNDDAAAMFRRLSSLQQAHLQALRTQPDPPSPIPASAEAAGPTRAANSKNSLHNPSQNSPIEDLYSHAHYLMNAHQVVQLALTAEYRVNERLSALTATLEQSSEQRRHLSELEQLLKRLPPPDNNWDEDPDPPNLDD